MEQYAAGISCTLTTLAKNWTKHLLAPKIIYFARRNLQTLITSLCQSRVQAQFAIVGCLGGSSANETAQRRSIEVGRTLEKQWERGASCEMHNNTSRGTVVRLGGDANGRETFRANSSWKLARDSGCSTNPFEKKSASLPAFDRQECELCINCI